MKYRTHTLLYRTISLALLAYTWIIAFIVLGILYSIYSGINYELELPLVIGIILIAIYFILPVIIIKKNILANNRDQELASSGGQAFFLSTNLFRVSTYLIISSILISLYYVSYMWFYIVLRNTLTNTLSVKIILFAELLLSTIFFYFSTQSTTHEYYIGLQEFLPRKLLVYLKNNIALILWITGLILYAISTFNPQGPLIIYSSLPIMIALILVLRSISSSYWVGILGRYSYSDILKAKILTLYMMYSSFIRSSIQPLKISPVTIFIRANKLHDLMQALLNEIGKVDIYKPIVFCSRDCLIDENMLHNTSMVLVKIDRVGIPSTSRIGKSYEIVIDTKRSHIDYLFAFLRDAIADKVGIYLFTLDLLRELIKEVDASIPIILYILSKMPSSSFVLFIGTREDRRLHKIINQIVTLKLDIE